MADSAEEQKQIDDAEKAVEQWKVKKLINTLEQARGNGTSMISLIVPPKDQVSRVAKMLGDEFGTASNIKSRVNRLSVLGAITSVQQRLKLFNRIPPNGLVIFCGEILTAEGKEKKIAIDFEPFKPINTSLYMFEHTAAGAQTASFEMAAKTRIALRCCGPNLTIVPAVCVCAHCRCDNKFHTEALNELLESDEKFGFIIMDGNGCLFGTLAGNTRTIIHKFSVDLPKKHGRGGQSALRFARLRLEKRHNYLRKVAEMATQCFIASDRPNVSGLILAGSAEFKNTLNGSQLFDPRLQTIVQKLVDVSYGGENGFNQAIELAQDCLANVKFIREKKLLTVYFAEIAKESGKYCFGVVDTLHALELGSVEELIVWEALDINRLILKHKESGVEKTVYVTERQEKEGKIFKADDGSDLETVQRETLLEWLANNFKSFGAKLQFVTDKSQEGSQFCRGFGGIGGILRYQVDFMAHEVEEVEDEDDFI